MSLFSNKLFLLNKSKQNKQTTQDWHQLGSDLLTMMPHFLKGWLNYYKLENNKWETELEGGEGWWDKGADRVRERIRDNKRSKDSWVIVEQQHGMLGSKSILPTNNKFKVHRHNAHRWLKQFPFIVLYSTGYTIYIMVSSNNQFPAKFSQCR